MNARSRGRDRSSLFVRKMTLFFLVVPTAMLASESKTINTVKALRASGELI